LIISFELWKPPRYPQKEKNKKIKFKSPRRSTFDKSNGVVGNFILDTGASNSCVGFESVALFQLQAEDSKTKASGAGATGMQTQTASNNKLQLGFWKHLEFDVVILIYLM
jgi:hypothetical protein